MHVIDREAERGSCCLGFLAGVCSKQQHGGIHGNTTTTRSHNHSRVSKGQGEKLIDMGAATKGECVCPSAEPLAARGRAGPVPVLLPSL